MNTPVVILSGFLGSGKTTLLLRLLHEARARGLRPGIMMNELGRQDVDGRIVDEYAQYPVEKLLDGCVCCSKKEELEGALRTLLQQQPDIIVMELTGVANPDEIAVMIADSFGGDVRKNRIITLLDAEHVLEYNSIFSSDRQLVRTLRRQIEAADLIIVNKTDLVSPGKLKKIEKTIAKLNAIATVTSTTHSQIDHELILGGIRPAGNPPAPAQPFRVIKGSPTESAHAHSSHSHREGQDDDMSFSTVKTLTLSLPPEGKAGKEKLERFLRQSGHRIIRAKGYVRLEDGMKLIQYAGNRITWEDSSYPGKPYLVIIGMELDERRLHDEWAAYCDWQVSQMP